MKLTTETMIVQFWGVRGSIATPGWATSEHGGNTACVSVTVGNQLLVFDLGTGARDLGDRLIKQGPRTLTVFLTHLHADHISGLPFFAPLHDRRFKVSIYGPPLVSRGLTMQLRAFASPPFFPLPLRHFQAQLKVHVLGGGDTVKVGPLRILADFVNHPWPTLGYRIEHHKVITYVSDHEPWRSFHHPSPRRIKTDGDQRLLELAQDADLLILDAQYSEREGRQRKGWGHGTPAYAANIARQANVGRLALFHHDPAHSDRHLKRLLQECLNGQPEERPRVLLAKEGLVLKV